MQYSAINLSDKLGQFTEHWTPKIVAEMNDYQIKLAKLSGEFVWHQHDDTDEMFFCVAGELDIQFRDGSVSLKAGELFVVPKGLEHKPITKGECHVVIIEPKGVVNTGTSGGNLTAPNDEWI